VVRRALKMGPEAATEFIKMLGNLQPGWVLAIVVAAILAYRSPQIIRELFAGLRGLFYGRRPRK
jgi:hypothetical protein